LVKKLSYFLFFLILGYLSISQEKDILKNEFNLNNEEKVLTFYDSVIVGIQTIRPEIRANKVLRFSALWNQGLQENHQKKLAEIVHIARDKGARWSVVLDQLFHQLYMATLKRKLPNASIDSLLITDRKAVQLLEKKELSSFLMKSAYLFETGIIHQHGSFQVKINRFKSVNFQALLDDDFLHSKENFSESSLYDDTFDESDPWEKIEEQAFQSLDEDYKALEDGNESDLNPMLLDNSDYLYEDVPSENGLIAKFKDIDLVFKSAFDSITIVGVSGTFLYENNYFLGKGGKFTWEQVGSGARRLWDGIGMKDNSKIIEHKIENTFDDFIVNLNTPLIEIHNSTMDFPYRSGKKVKGKFSYLVRNKGISDYTYPRFISNTNNVDILNLSDSVKVEGGIYVVANRLFSKALDRSLGKLTYDKDGNQFKLIGEMFELTDTMIRTDYAKSVILFRRDSISHPGSYVKFSHNKKELLLVRNKKKLMRYAPFESSYHDLDIDVDKVLWQMADSTASIIFQNFYARDVREAKFRSKDYYRDKDYFQLKGLYRFHPLQLMCHLYFKNKIKVFTTEMIASKTGVKEQYIKNNLSNLESKHLIKYNDNNGNITLTQKGKMWFLSAKKMIDHDQMEIISLSPRAHAADMDLQTGLLKIYSIHDITISDSLQVDFQLSDSTVIVDQGKNLLMEGTIQTSREKFTGTNFRFNYDSFLVHMDTVEYIALSIENDEPSEGEDEEDIDKTENSSGENDEEEYDEERTLHKSSGTLYLNAPNNKSGLGYLPQYPYFNSQSGAYVFFNTPSVINGAYDKRVYFYIPPFGMDSLSFEGAKEASFKGEFETDGIFPKMEEVLTVMKDKSLGIKNDIPAGGFPLYKNKGRITGSFAMDKQGLRVNGVYKYLNTTALSSDFILYQDSVVTNGTEFGVKAGVVTDGNEGVIFPKIKVNDYHMVLNKLKGEINASNMKDPFSIYNNRAKLNGTIKIAKSGLSASGMLQTFGTRAFSSSFNFGLNKFQSSNTKFEVPSEDPSKPAMISDNVKLTFDFNKETAEFYPEKKGDAVNSFPFLAFETTLYHGIWDINKSTITFDQGDLSNENDTSFFRSTRADQDFMKIYAKNGIYFKDSLKLEINGVKRMNISGADVFPEGEKVIVRENGELDIFSNAIIKMDTLHTLYNASLKVSSSNGFSGEALYDFTNTIGDVYHLSFKNFKQINEQKAISDTSKEMMLIAKSEIRESDNFFIQEDMQFKGISTIYSKKKNLGFDGYVKPNINGAIEIKDWMKFSTDGSEKLILIPVDSLENEDQVLLSNGIFLSGLEDDLYYKMIAPKEMPGDRIIFDASGFLNHDAQERQIRIGSRARMNETSSKGNLMIYNEKKNNIIFDGLFNLAKIEDTSNVNLLTSGHQDFNLRNPKYKINSLTQLIFKLPENMYSNMSFKLNDVAEIKGIKGESQKLPNLYDKAIHLIDDTITVKQLEENNFPLHMSHPNFLKGIVFSDITMNWSDDNTAWYSNEKAVISNIEHTEIDAKFTTYLEVVNWSEGDIINLYIEVDGSTKIWYFFTYNESTNTLKIGSSESVMTEMFNVKKQKKPKKGQLIYKENTEAEMKNFVDKYKTNYLGYTLDELEEQF